MSTFGPDRYKDGSLVEHWGPDGPAPDPKPSPLDLATSERRIGNLLVASDCTLCGCVLAGGILFWAWVMFG